MSNNLIKWTSLNPFLSHRDEFVTSFDRIFNEIFENAFPDSTKEFGVDLFSKGAYPKVNIVDDENQISIEAEIPGLTKEQVKIEVQDDILMIKGERREKQDNSKKTYVYRELKQSSFVRSFQLNDNLDSDKIDAKFKDGILEITIPKKVPESKVSKTKVIDIQ